MMHGIRMLQCLVLASGLVLGAAPVHASPGAGAAAPAAVKDLHSRRGYLALSPGVIAIGLLDGRSMPARYIWGVEAGYHFPFGRSLMIQPGLAFEHSAFRQPGAYTPEGVVPLPRRGHLMRVGPQVRIGGGNARVFGYALLSVATGLIVTDRFRSDHFDRLVLPTVMSTIGGGVQGLVVRKLLLGGEVNIDVLGLGPILRARLYAGIMF